MRWALILFFSGSLSWAQSISGQVDEFIKHKDDLGLRVYLREKLKTQVSIKEWLDVREALTVRPNAGYDLVFAWDRHKNVKGLNLSQTHVDKAMTQGDQLFEQKKFDEAFKKYQAVAKAVKQAGKGKIRLQNRQFYFSVLQAMARSLYGAGRYSEALEVYTWIPPYYFQIRQALFEKMWAAFRAGKYDQVVGSIASQQSGYFSTYLDPESYLIKIYVMKRLCRTKDIELTLASIQTYLKDLETGQVTYKDWARRDLVMSGFDILINSPPAQRELLEVVNMEKRESEKKRLTSFLTKSFERNRPRLISQLQKVLGYSKLAVVNPSAALTQITDLADSETLSKKGFEWWPATGGEEWLDEIGSHVYIGDSLCSRQ